MKDKKNFYINGKWQTPKSKQQIEVVNPSTEEKCAIITLGSKEDVDIAVNSAKEAYNSWAFSTKEESVVVETIDILPIGLKSMCKLIDQ